MCFLERSRQDFELLLKADSWERYWRLEDFGFRVFLMRRALFFEEASTLGVAESPSGRIPVFGVFETEDSETINTPPFPTVCIS